MLDKYLRGTLLGCNIQVIDEAMPAHMVTSVFHEINRIATSTADLVIEDYTVNDQRGKQVFRGRINDSLTMRNQVGAHEYLAQRLRAQRTALIMMEAYPNFHHPLVCQADLEHSHTVIAEAHAVPVLSFMRAVCNESETAARSSWPAEQHWRSGCGVYDKPGAECMPHPGPYTHRVYAKLLAIYIFRQAAAAIMVNESLRPDDQASALRTVVLPREQSIPAGSGPFVFSVGELEGMRGCASALSKVDAEASCEMRIGKRFGRAAGTATGWSCYEDRPGKPGWIANTTSDRTPRTLIFHMSMTFTGFLVVAFLRSYEGMGTVSIFIDGNKTGAVTLDGRWAQRTSQTDYVAIPLAQLRNVKELGAVHHPMVHEVQLQMPSLEEQQKPGVGHGSVGKFKLIALSTC